MGPQVRGALRSDALSNRERILQAARFAVASQGPSVPLSEIALLARVGVATVHRHFGTRAALMTEALEQPDTLCSDLVAIGLRAADPWDGFSRAVRGLIDLHAPGRRSVQRFPGNTSMTAMVSAERRRSLQLMLRLLDRAKAAGAVRGDIDVEDVVLVLTTHQGVAAYSPELRQRASERFAALVLASFRAPESARPLPAWPS